jgi:hypothetical protein
MVKLLGYIPLPDLLVDNYTFLTTSYKDYTKFFTSIKPLMIVIAVVIGIPILHVLVVYWYNVLSYFVNINSIINTVAIAVILKALYNKAFFDKAFFEKIFPENHSINVGTKRPDSFGQPDSFGRPTSPTGVVTTDAILNDTNLNDLVMQQFVANWGQDDPPEEEPL